MQYFQWPQIISDSLSNVARRLLLFLQLTAINFYFLNQTSTANWTFISKSKSFHYLVNFSLKTATVSGLRKSNLIAISANQGDCLGVKD